MKSKMNYFFYHFYKELLEQSFIINDINKKFPNLEKDVIIQ